MIPEEVIRLLGALERFEVLRASFARLGGRGTDLSYASFAGRLCDPVRAVLTEALRTDRDLAFQYTPVGGSRTARTAVAVALSPCHDQPYTWNDLVLTSGAAAALSTCLRAIAEPGAEVLIPSPCWLDHPLYAAAAGMRPVQVPLRPDDDFDPDPAVVAQAVSTRTVAVVLTNPANPTGRTLGRDSIEALADALAWAERRHGTQITVVADETHRDLANTEKWSAVARTWRRSVTVYSFGKYHAIQGQRLGYAAVSPRHPDRRALADDLGRWLRIVGNATPTALMQLALPGLLTIRHDTTDLATWRDRFVSTLRASGFQVVPPDSTHFVYVRTPDGMPDEQWVETLAREAGVLTLPASVFHHEGYFRLALTAAPERLANALYALGQAGLRWCPTSR